MKTSILKASIASALILVGAWITLQSRSSTFDLEPGSAVIISIWGGFVFFLIERVESWLRGERSGGASRVAVIASTAIIGVALLAVSRCTHDDRSAAQRRFDYACEHYEAHR